MTKKIIFIVGFLLLASGLVFADNASEEIQLPKNTIAVDIDLFLLLFSGVMMLMDYHAPTFGVAVQYERQITEQVSLGGRFGYSSMNILDHTDLSMSSFSINGYGRYFPGRGVFFAGGSLGYANAFFNNNISNSMSHHFRFGGILGWRINFGKPKGFVLEPSISYFMSVGTRLNTGYDDNEFLGDMLDTLYSLIASGLFISGPRFNIALGWRF
jgi:hypothetical protein